MLGGHLSDVLVRSKKWGLTGRPFVAATSSLVAIPFVALALLAGYPDCFLYFIPSGLVRDFVSCAYFTCLLSHAFAILFCDRQVKCISGHL